MKAKILFLLLTLSATCFTTAKAQTWFDVAAVSPISSSSGSGSVVNTGNDRRDFASMSVTLNVNVWDGNSPGLGWDDGVNTPGIVALAYSDAQDPDVCLIYNYSTSDIFAVVAYYSPGQSAYYYQYFRWNNSTYLFTAGTATSFQSANCFYKTVNIDGDTYEHFAIVWDMLDGGSGCSGNPDVWCVTGGIILGLPALYSCGAILVNDHAISCTTCQYGMMPDVALYDQTGTGATEKIIISYILAPNSTSNTGYLEVDYDNDFLDLTATNGCTPSWNRTQNGPAIYGYYYPRVAAVNGGIPSMRWTVVLEDNNASSRWLISGYTLTSGSGVLSHIYNDGNSDSPGNIKTVTNLRPAVSYNNSDDRIYVGWHYDNNASNFTGNGASAKAIYPIVLLCDSQGYMFSNVQHYWEVPISMNAGDDIESISIAGRYDRNYMLYTYYDIGAGDVYYKTVQPYSSTLRKWTTEPIAEATSLFPNPNDGNFTIEYELQKGDGALEIFNELGEKVYAQSLQQDQANQKISLTQLSAGIYYYQIKNKNETTSRKFIKQ